MSQFTFTIKIGTGDTYTYSGTLESLYRHLQANKHLDPQVLESETRFKAPGTQGTES